ncbi:hypothetical protein ACFS6H_20095 [Terrimonas rubra]|uniref:Uncharacterized protein n=1 Tax=Terrimonas rubra TaxID=1035890 RepID=A0ABW6A9L8_9BACT
MKFINSCAVACILWLLLWAACGCKTTKYVERTKTVYDSTAIYQNQVLKQTIADQKQYYEELIKDSNGYKIEFFPENRPLYKPSPYYFGGKVDTAIINRLIRVDTTWYDSLPKGVKQWYNDFEKESNMLLPWQVDESNNKKFILRKDGTIEASGNIKTVQVSATKQAQFLSELQHKYDSAVLSNENRKVEVKTETKELIKKVERRVYPLWLIGLVIIGTWTLCTHRYKIPYFSTIIKFLRL